MFYGLVRCACFIAQRHISNVSADSARDSARTHSANGTSNADRDVTDSAASLASIDATIPNQEYTTTPRAQPVDKSPQPAQTKRKPPSMAV